MVIDSVRIPRISGSLLLAAACFVAGLGTGATLVPGHALAPVAQATPQPVQIAPVRAAYQAEVLRVIDGDTFEARVRVWPNMDVTTKVRLRGIDAAEMHARCADERVKAEAARVALTRLLGEGAVGVAGVTLDKFGGRIDAEVSTARTRDVSAAMLDGGFARRYSGGRRENWCG